MDKKSIGLVILVIVVAAATWWFNQDDNDQSNHYYVFNLDGESENWDLNQYKVEFVPTSHTAGGGTLHFNGERGPIVDSLNFQTYALVDGVEVTLQSESIHEPLDASTVNIGFVDNNVFKPNGDPVMFQDIEKIHAEIEWPGASGEYQTEEIVLYELRKK
ncbi:hypothetical protein [Piscibacillus salipiscarius]|uniref:Uncharacterized protein n=1 Tax=Piscibacillus salipiscarius TaxID=299480 RepID=A0ABW5Q9C6_9BACI|nr:hypothetical protein [Piscibacillus salipiscarius]